MTEELYVLARRTLLDGLEALADHRDALILVGAQAIYLRYGEGDIAVPPFTKDADLACDPGLLGALPPLERLLTEAGFRQETHGTWLAARMHSDLGLVDMPVDLLVPTPVTAGRQRRGARLRGHDPAAARNVTGLEGALVDWDVLPISSLEADDPRAIVLKVAGPAALLVAKLHKIQDRVGKGRSRDKDGLDIFRMLREVPTEELAERYRRLLEDDRSRASAEHARDLVREHLRAGGAAAAMAASAAAGFIDPDEVRQSCGALSRDLLDRLG